MTVTKSVIKKKRIHIISIWIYVKVKDENDKYYPKCVHYSSKNKFKPTGLLPRQMTVEKTLKVQNDFEHMTKDDIDALPTEEDFIQIVNN
jgi:hypothetical protein